MKKQILPTLLGLAFAGQVFGAKVIPNNAAADLVLGQADFVTSTSQQQSSFSLQRPEGIVIDPVTRKVFVGSYTHDRLLRFPSVASLTSGAGAEAVFGQANFGGPSSNTPLEISTNGVIGLAFDRKGRLWVADTLNNRVLMYEAASYRSDQPKPDRVFGQSNLTTNAAGTSSSSMSSPYGVFVDSEDRLWVAENNNNRVLFFNSVSSKSSGAAADGVLGQAGFNTSVSGTTNNTMSSPQSIAISATGTLYVADSGNNRILRFDNAATIGNGGAATRVLGQANFTSSSTGLSSSTFSYPTAVSLDANGALWVTDYNNQRLVRFNDVASKANGAAADAVVGQPDFVSNASSVTGKGSIISYSSAFPDATGSIWIADTEHNRALRFPADVTKPLLTLTGTVPKTTTKKNVTIKGTASDTYGISKVQYRIGTGAVQTATGATSWQFTAPLKNGKNTITIFATDSVGNVSLSKVIKIKRS